MSPREERIAAVARRIYEDEGCPEGRAEEHWHRAEKMVEEGWNGAESDIPPSAASREDSR